MLDKNKMDEMIELQSQAYASLANFLPAMVHRMTLLEDSFDSCNSSFCEIVDRLDRLDRHFVELCNALMEEL